MNDDMYTFVAGGALEAGVTFNVKCNCGGKAPITPASVAGYGYSKHGPALKVVDKFETKCSDCDTTIHALVIEGDPGYVLTSNKGHESLLLPQGSTAPPISTLTAGEKQAIIDDMQTEIAKDKAKKNQKKRKKKK